MAKYRYRANVIIRQGDLDSFLDMLRYDGCRVDSWVSSHVDGTRLVRLINDKPFTEPRWASFSLYLDMNADRVR